MFYIAGNIRRNKELSNWNDTRLFMLLLYEHKCLVRLPTVASNDIKVEPQSLQRCRNDQRRPLAQLWPTTPCLSHQKTNFIGKQLKKEEKEQTLDGIWTPGSSGFWRLVRWKDVGNGACSRVGPMRRLISSRSPAWMAAVVLCGRGVEKPRSLVLETRRGCMYLNRVASDSISRATRFPCIRTTCTGATGAPGTLIKTGQSRSLAKDVACIPPSYDGLPELAAAGVRQDYPFLGELAEASKRLLFWTDISSHQAIIRARVDGNEHVDLEEVTTLALDQQSDIPCVSIKIRASMHISQVSAFGRFVSDDKTGLERSAITPVCTVAQSVSTSAWPAGYDTQYSRRMLVPDSDALMLLEGKENYGVYPDR
ncbi:uncharacterized protein [Drosophila pseudoobscura]|uniref:Uncharacterized protein isoform X2 n=1 Tax=Drosophila pseudoobscura pseudoobscura TaxID=46245 RepID=A0A6I8VT81_DROPS|nr:uncharacterized protein LOC6898442 isoform X2 [Drosophila pseudoobscura]